MARRASEFQTIRSEGGLLPPDLLRRVLDPREKLEGTHPEDYGLPQGERLNEMITQSWNRLRKHWAEFRSAASNLPEGEPGTGLTNDKWNLPLLRELGFGLLPTSAGPEIGGRTYAISRFFGPVPVHLVGCGLSLDRRAAGVRGAAAVNPHGLVQEFLNRSPGHLWAILSNGLRLRVLRDNQALSRQSFLEFDLESMFVGEVYSDFVLLWLMAHATRFAPREADRTETCWLEQWTKFADEQGTRALGDLRGGVERALQILGEGFTSHPKNTALRDALRTGQVTPVDFHGQLLRVIYRLIFLFVAEDRTIDGQSLLHPRDDSQTTRLARERYAAHYSTARSRELASRIKGSRHGDLWKQFQILVSALSGESGFATQREQLALPSLGSLLWNPTATAALNDAELTNYDFLESLRNLAFTRQGKTLRAVDFKNLGAEELGGVYESLLALTPQISADGARFTFAEFAGSERKTSGSYYTPDSLVQCLLDSALDPVVEEAIKGKTAAEAEKAILGLKVCDPAVGSGHFLVGAAHRLARHLARVRALVQGESEPSPLLYQHALRDVIGRCLYGVDINPMAAELCRVGLWLEALEPGKPLSFLDQHIRVGNSLLGATPELIAAGLPDDTFSAVEGDDKRTCAVLKMRNRAERKGLGPLFAKQDAETQSSLARAAAALEALPDDRPEDIRAKELALRRHEETEEYRHKRQLADAWCAAFVIRKHFDQPGRESSASGITQGLLNNLAAGQPLPAELKAETGHLSGQYQFFHWHLAFPDVFAKGGFDCVLGNPPWENIKADPVEFFAAAASTVATAPTADVRAARIQELTNTDPDLGVRWSQHQRYIAGQQHFVSSSGRFPFGAHGKCNTMPLFLELFAVITTSTGYAGIVLKSVIGTDAEYQPLFQRLVTAERITGFLDFINEGGLFPDVHRQERFALVTVSPEGASPCGSYAFRLESPADLSKRERVLALTADDLKAMANGSCRLPTVTEPAQVRLLITVARNCGSTFLSRESAVDSYIMLDGGKVASAPGFCTVDGFSARYGSRAFGQGPHGEEVVPVYEGKLFGNLDHRYRTFEGISVEARYGKTPATKTLSDDDKRDPHRTLEPRYWVSRRFVDERLQDRGWTRHWLVLHGRKGNRDNQRTFSAAVVPSCASVDVAPIIVLRSESDDFRPVISAAAAGQSFAFDYLVRMRLVGFSIGKNLLEEIPAPGWAAYLAVCQWERLRTVFDWLLPHVLELTYTAWDLEPFAQDCGWSGPPFRWDEQRRFLIRCELDAAFFHLYLPTEINGDWRPAESETEKDLARLKASFPTPRDAVAYIMDTFPIVKRRDEEKWGDFRTKRVVLEIYDAMQEAIRTGHPYQTRLDPPPGDARCCHPPKKAEQMEE